MGVQTYFPVGGGVPKIVSPTTPGAALTDDTNGAPSWASGTWSLSLSGSVQSGVPSPSKSGRLLSMKPSQLSSTPLQTSGDGLPGVQVPGAPLTQAGAVPCQGPPP